MTYPPPGDYGPPPPDPAYPPSSYPPPSYQAPAYPPPSYQAPSPYPPVLGYQPPPAYTDPYSPGYGSPYGYSPYPPKAPNDGLAIASLVVSCVAVAGLCGYGIGGLIGVIGAVLGHASRRRIKNTGVGGDGMALAGIIVGWTAAAIAILVIAGIVAIIVLSPDTPDTY